MDDLTVSVKELVRVTAPAASAINSRLVGMKPILGFMLISANGQRGSVTATNLETFIKLEFTCDAPKTFLALLPAAKANSWLSLVPQDEPVCIEKTVGGVKLRCARNTAAFSTERVEDFPPFVPTGNQSIELPCGLVHAAMRLRYATDPDTQKFALGGVCLCIDAGKLRAMATDQRQAAILELGDAGQANAGMWIIPGGSCAIVSRALQGPADAPCRIHLNANKAQFSAHGSDVECRLLEGRFPRAWETGGGKYESHASCVVPVDTISGACRIAAIATESPEKQGRRYADFTLSDGELTISGSGDGEASSSTPVSYSGPSVTAHIGIPYVTAFLSQCVGVDDVELGIRNDSGVARIAACGSGNEFYSFIRQSDKGAMA